MRWWREYVHIHVVAIEHFENEPGHWAGACFDVCLPHGSTVEHVWIVARAFVLSRAHPVSMLRHPIAASPPSKV